MRADRDAEPAEDEDPGEIDPRQPAEDEDEPGRTRPGDSPTWCAIENTRAEPVTASVVAIAAGTWSPRSSAKSRRQHQQAEQRLLEDPGPEQPDGPPRVEAGRDRLRPRAGDAARAIEAPVAEQEEPRAARRRGRATRPPSRPAIGGGTGRSGARPATSRAGRPPGPATATTPGPAIAPRSPRRPRRRRPSAGPDRPPARRRPLVEHQQRQHEQQGGRGRPGPRQVRPAGLRRRAARRGPGASRREGRSTVTGDEGAYEDRFTSRGHRTGDRGRLSRSARGPCRPSRIGRSGR